MRSARRDAGPRKTWQRDIVQRVLNRAGCHLTAEEIHDRARRLGRRIGLATVYRALEAFAREGLAEPVYVGDGRVRYGLAAKHHDHLVCLRCGEWKSIDDCVLPAPAARVASGFRITGHRLELYGFCAACEGAAG